MATPRTNPRPRPRKPNARGTGERLREDLLVAAQALLDESGDPIGVTVRGVAARVGVAPTAVYLHFPNRDTLLVEAVAGRFAEFRDRLAEIVASTRPPLAQLRDGHATYMAFARANPGVYRGMFGGVSLSPATAELGARLVEVVQPAFDSLVTMVRRCIEAGDLPAGVDAVAFARVLFTCEHGWSDLVGTGRGTLLPNPDDILDTLLSLTGRPSGD